MPIVPNPAGGFRRLWGLRRNPEETEPGRRDDTAAWPWQSEPVDVRSVRLRIVHVNDTHHFHLGDAPVGGTTTGDGQDDAETPFPDSPLGSLATLIAGGRESGIDTLYLSAGDEHTGTSLDELLGYTPELFSRSVAYEMQSAMGLDAAAVGNHDLDRGPAILEQAARMSARFPLLSANLVGSRQFTTFCHAVVGLTSGGIRIVVVGLTTEEQVQVRSKLDDGLRVSDPLEAARFWVDTLSPSTDVVVVLSHLGLNEPGSRHTVRVDDRALAHALGNVDRRDTPLLIIGSHTHSVIDHETAPLHIAGIPVFQAGCNLERAGVIDIDHRNTRGRVVRLERGSLQNPTLVNPARAAAAEVGAAVLRPVTRIGERERAAKETVLEDRLSGECGIANKICDVLRDYMHESAQHEIAQHGSAQHLVVACDASGILGGIGESAELRVDDLYRILPYADSLYQAVVKPADLLSILASNVLRRLPPDSLRSRGGPVDPTDWARIARGFLHFSGNLRYRAGLSGLRWATLDGTPLSSLPERRSIRMICNSFSAMGNQGWGPLDTAAFEEFGSVSLPGLGFEDRGEPLRQVLISSLSRKTAVDLVTDGRAIFDSR